MFSQERNFSGWQLTGFSGAPAYLFETIGSTHKLMKSMAASGEIAPGTLFVADSQSDGHGRHERTWDSPAGKNLYFNILIPLKGIPASSYAQITQVAALTFAETFNNIQGIAATENRNGAESASASTPKITVKWPNDILYGKSKFCGILAEIVFIRQQQSEQQLAPQQKTPPRPALSMGVGINVNSEPSDYAHLNRAVTTLKAIFGRTINREKLLQALVGNLERAIGQFKAFGIRPWVEAWKRMDQFIGSRGTIVVNNHCTDQNRDTGEGSIKKTGRIIDMNDDGSLLFECDDGTIETVISADLEI
ncbi:biotin--acetyl-CoA-carboxylase ligase [Fibrobacter succinogenes subsp. succinogenes S85]|uniref:Biotin--acetyl-CoA-carboxylase ligase n=1 Tax=Fibrobacter succinogenes (strain ATCC 19169 / S85) TaxID=59374 RepID=C9RIN2_FIBSS|nr:biotin--[acetyl-CoA-carboxylase] ligase [Fibrobacter succinogenes]ACX75503.1 biotin/acetyl-CoA-carboxylase ligase [Fibrobacter succinogenes subsp. succinogenes S85]ADL26363.1 biotin--acetyl-CoA-carboxylase ligase [Fibrobacter succinogenes subsp. succinogenes S85]